jgi:HEAT repeat protein
MKRNLLLIAAALLLVPACRSGRKPPSSPNPLPSVLLGELKSPEVSVRLAAARSLAARPQPGTVGALLFALYDEDARVREAAARALGEAGDRTTVEPLGRKLSDPAEGVRIAIVEALGKLGGPGAGRAVCSVLGDTAAPVRVTACKALGRIGAPRSVPYLAAALSDEEAGPHAADALVKIGPPAVDSLREALRGEGGVLAALALGRIKAPEAAPDLVVALGRKDTHEYAAWALGEIGVPALSALFHALSHSDRSVRIAALDILGGMRGEEARVKLMAMQTRARDVRIRLGVAFALARGWQDQSAYQILKQTLVHSAWDVRELAARSLGEIGDATALRLLVDTVKYETDWAVRDAAFDALVTAGSRGREALVLLLGDDLPGVRGRAARALGRLGDRAAVPALIRALSDKKWTVGQAAAEALRALTGKDFGGDAESWRVWWDAEKK